MRQTRVWKLRAAVAAVGLAGSLGGGVCIAQTCTPEFADGFEYPGVQGYIKASIVYDAQDGNGPRLIVAGSFSRAGGKLCNGIAYFDGTNFQPLGGGLPSGSIPTAGSGIVNAMEVFDPDGDGPLKPELWVGGSFNRARQASGALVTVNGLARWNGSTQTWASVPLSPAGVWQTQSLLADTQTTGPNQGPRIYVANTVASGTSRYITAYRWNGSAYTQLQMGPVNGAPVLSNIVFSLAKLNGRVYLGGAFSDFVRVVAADGTGHELLANQMPNPDTAFVQRMAVFNNRLIAGLSSGAPQSFDGSTWQTETFGGATDTVRFHFGSGNPDGWMKSIDLGTGPKLYIGGSGVGFRISDGSPTAYAGAVVWDGTTLSPLAGGIATASSFVPVSTFAVTTLRGQQAVFVGIATLPGFSGVNANGSRTPASNALWFDGTSWLPQYPTPKLGGLSGTQVVKLDGINDRIVTQGGSIFSDTANPNGIAAYNGNSWSNSSIPLPPNGGTQGYTRYDDGTGEKLFCGFYKWDGTDWTALPPCPLVGSANGGVNYATTVFDTDGPGPERPWLVFAGNFVGDDSTLIAHNVFAWDGSNWRTLGSGLQDGSGDNGLGTILPIDTGAVRSLAIYNDGSGPKLYAGGSFVINDVIWQVARYDGTGSTGTWTAIGKAPSFYVNTLRPIDLGAGPKLYAAGPFSDLDDGTTPNATPNLKIARWDPPAWTALNVSSIDSIPSSPLVASINDIIGFDDGSGSGPAIFACGPFQSINGATVNGFAKYDGTNWTGFGSGLNSFNENLRLSPSTFVVFDDDASGPSRPALYISGGFDNANGKYAQNFARFGCPRVACVADFDQSGTITIDDIFIYLNAWFAGCNGSQSGAPCFGRSCDVTGPDGVNIDDIFVYINRWFAGC